MSKRRQKKVMYRKLVKELSKFVGKRVSIDLTDDIVDSISSLYITSKAYEVD